MFHWIFFRANDLNGWKVESNLSARTNKIAGCLRLSWHRMLTLADSQLSASTCVLLHPHVAALRKNIAEKPKQSRKRNENTQQNKTKRLENAANSKKVTNVQRHMWKTNNTGQDSTLAEREREPNKCSALVFIYVCMYLCILVPCGACAVNLFVCLPVSVDMCGVYFCFGTLSLSLNFTKINTFHK